MAPMLLYSAFLSPPAPHHNRSVFCILSGWISYCPPKAHVQTTSVPQQCIQRIFHIPQTFFLSLAIDYCTFVRVIQVNKVFISLLAMGTRGLPTPPAHVFKITMYINRWQNFYLNMSYDLFDFVFHNNNIVNKNADIALVRGTHW
jgi:hypothetical protein